MSVYPQVGEAVISYVPGLDAASHPRPELSEEERTERNRRRATSRASTESMRYIVANRLRYMWVLTFAEALDGADGRAECMRQVAEFAARLRATVGPLAYWFSPELHPGGHGWHVNFFVGKRLRHREVVGLWERGHVWVKDWTKDSRVKQLNLGFVEALKLGAMYGCKYASKDWSEQVLLRGAHRYEVAQGFAPRVRVFLAPTDRDGVRFACEVFGYRPPASVWSSGQVESWEGPAVMVLTWTSPAPRERPNGR